MMLKDALLFFPLFQRLQSPFDNVWLPFPLLTLIQTAWGLSSNMANLLRGDLCRVKYSAEVDALHGVQTNSCTSATVQNYAHKYTPSVWIRAALFFFSTPNTHTHISARASFRFDSWVLDLGHFKTSVAAVASKCNICQLEWMFSTFAEFLCVILLINVFIPFNRVYTSVSL